MNTDSPYSQKIIRNMYVDNLIFEADNSNQALDIYRESKKIFSLAN